MTVGSYTSYLRYPVDGSMERAIKVTYNIHEKRCYVEKQIHHFMCDFRIIYWRLLRMDYRSDINQQTFIYLLMTWYLTWASQIISSQQLMFCAQRTEAKTWRIWQPFKFPVRNIDKNLNKLLTGEDFNKLKNWRSQKYFGTKKS